MAGGIKPISSSVKSTSAELFLDLPTMSAPSGEERTPDASAQVERAGLCASAVSTAHSRVYGACAAEAAASESSGLSVGGCPEHRRYFGPYPVGYPLGA